MAGGLGHVGRGALTARMAQSRLRGQGARRARAVHQRRPRLAPSGGGRSRGQLGSSATRQERPRGRRRAARRRAAVWTRMERGRSGCRRERRAVPPHQFGCGAGCISDSWKRVARRRRRNLVASASSRQARAAGASAAGDACSRGVPAHWRGGPFISARGALRRRMPGAVSKGGVWLGHGGVAARRARHLRRGPQRRRRHTRAGAHARAFVCTEFVRVRRGRAPPPPPARRAGGARGSQG